MSKDYHEPIPKEKEPKRTHDNAAPSPDSNEITGAFTAPPQFNLNSTFSNSMPEDTIDHMSNALGDDFSEVNIHKDSQSAVDTGALAYTQGNDIHFAPGQYDPVTQRGKQLLGHELTHVIQQREGRVEANSEVNGTPLNDDAGLENEANEGGMIAADHSHKKREKEDFTPARRSNTPSFSGKNQHAVQQKKDLGYKSQAKYIKSFGPKTWEGMKFWFGVEGNIKTDLSVDTGLDEPGKAGITTKKESSDERKKETDKSSRKSKTKHAAQLSTDLLDPFNVALEAELSEDKIGLNLKVNVKNEHLGLEGKATLIQYNDTTGDFEALSASIEGQFFTEMIDQGVTVDAGASAKLKVEYDKNEILKKIGKFLVKKITKEEVEKFAERTIVREAEKQGVKLGAKGVFNQVVSKVNPVLAVLSAFETGWTIGTLLRKYTVAGEVADKEMENLAGYKDRYENSDTTGKIGWSIVYSPKIGWTMVKAGVKGVAAAAGESFGKIIYADDNVMAETKGDFLEKYGFDIITVEEKIKYFKDLGGNWVTESEEERLVKIFEYSTASDRQILMKNPDVFRVYRNNLDGADLKRFNELNDEARGKKELPLFDSQLNQYNLNSFIKKVRKDLYSVDPQKSIRELPGLNLWIKDVAEEKENSWLGEADKFYDNFLKQLTDLKNEIEAMSRMELVSPYVSMQLKIRNQFNSKLQYNIWGKIQKTIYDLDDYEIYSTSQSNLDSLQEIYAQTVVHSGRNGNDSTSILQDIESNIIKEIEVQISFCEKYLDKLGIDYSYSAFVEAAK